MYNEHDINITTSGMIIMILFGVIFGILFCYGIRWFCELTIWIGQLTGQIPM